MPAKNAFQFFGCLRTWCSRSEISATVPSMSNITISFISFKDEKRAPARPLFFLPNRFSCVLLHSHNIDIGEIRPEVNSACLERIRFAARLQDICSTCRETGDRVISEGVRA